MQKKSEFIISICAIAVIVICAFAPAVKNDFINWDDPGYVTENAYINHVSLANIKALLTTSFVGTYQPVANLTYLLEHHFFGSNASFYHATNILLHFFNCILVFWLVMLLDGNILVSLVTALLFGLHPLRVESVAWISERKDVLYSFFFLWALVDYCRYIRDKSVKYYYRSFFLFLLSLGSKAMAATLPLVFFAVDYLLKRRFNKKIILEKAPFFIFAFLFGLIAVFAQGRSLKLGHGEPFVILRQLSAPFYGTMMYLYKTVFPVNLSLIYPYPPQNAGFYLVCLISAIFILFVAGAVIFSKRFTRKVNFAFLFALITILPVLQFIPIGTVIMADRYTYLPSIGICYIASAGFFYLYNMKHRYMPLVKTVQIIFLAGIVAALFLMTYNRTQAWKDSITIFSDVIKKYPDAYIAHNNRGDAYFKQGNLPQAISDYTRAIEIDPGLASAYDNRALAYAKQGNLTQAISDCTRAIEINHNYVGAYDNRGVIYYDKGNLPQAISDFTRAIEINPNIAKVYLNRGAAYGKQGNLPEAISDYTRAIEINPDYADAYDNRGAIYYGKGNLPRAISDYTMAIKINPGYAGAYNNRGIAYAQQGNLLQAIADSTRAIEINPEYAQAYLNRGIVYYTAKEYDKAWADVHKAEGLGCAVNPGFIVNLKKASGEEN